MHDTTSSPELLVEEEFEPRTPAIRLSNRQWFVAAAAGVTLAGVFLSLGIMIGKSLGRGQAVEAGSSSSGEPPPPVPAIAAPSPSVEEPPASASPPAAGNAAPAAADPVAPAGDAPKDAAPPAPTETKAPQKPSVAEKPAPVAPPSPIVEKTVVIAAAPAAAKPAPVKAPTGKPAPLAVMKPAAGSPPAKGSWVLQIVAYNRQDQAEAKLKALQKLGMQNVYLSNTEKPGGVTLYRVRAGPFASKESAAAHALEKKSSLGDTFVTKE
ncbi:MAG: hypothetical protein GMKNLPBB_02458 [Myxococcota bacterium]|nr:hypothetical protein [Myxococcota bacterium]